MDDSSQDGAFCPLQPAGEYTSITAHLALSLVFNAVPFQWRDDHNRSSTFTVESFHKVYQVFWEIGRMLANYNLMCQFTSSANIHSTPSVGSRSRCRIAPHKVDFSEALGFPGYCLFIRRWTRLSQHFKEEQHLSDLQSARLALLLDALSSHLRLVRMTMCSHVNILAGWGSEELNKQQRTSPIHLSANQEMKRSCK